MFSQYFFNKIAIHEYIIFDITSVKNNNKYCCGCSFLDEESNKTDTVLFQSGRFWPERTFLASYYPGLSQYGIVVRSCVCACVFVHACVYGFLQKAFTKS